MVAHVLRLRLDLLLGAFRGDRGRVVRTIVSGVLLVAAAVLVCIAIATLRDNSAAVAAAVTILTGSAIFLGVAIAPAVGGIEDQLDPRRFALFGLPSRPLAATLILGAFISVPSLALLALSCAFAVLWVSLGAPVLLTWFAALLGYITWVVLSRVSMATASLVLHGRRSREMTGLFIVAVVVIIVPVTVFMSSLDWNGVVPTQLDEAMAVLSVTPLGAAWALPGLALRGDAGTVWGVTAIAVATLALVVWAWFALVDRLLSTTERPLGERGRDGLGWFTVTPSTPGGAIAARSLIYWMRDRRYIVNIVIVPFAAVIAALPLLVAGVPPHIVALVPIPILALFLGWMPHNDIAYDSTAVWLHIVSGVRGISDRLGRLLPITLIAVPLLAIGVAISSALFGRWAVLPALAGVATCLFLAGLGLSSISSVLAPYPVTRPGDSPFQQPQRAGSGIGAQGLVLAGSIIVSIPTLWLAWLSVNDDMNLALPTMWVGIGSGVLVLVIGVTIGALLFDRRGSQVMEFAEAI